MAEIAEKVMSREAFLLDDKSKVVLENSILYITRSGREGFFIYSESGNYIGFAYNIPIKSILEPAKPLDISPI